VRAMVSNLFCMSRAMNECKQGLSIDHAAHHSLLHSLQPTVSVSEALPTSPIMACTRGRVKQ